MSSQTSASVLEFSLHSSKIQHVLNANQKLAQSLKESQDINRIYSVIGMNVSQQTILKPRTGETFKCGQTIHFLRKSGDLVSSR